MRSRNRDSESCGPGAESPIVHVSIFEKKTKNLHAYDMCVFTFDRVFRLIGGVFSSKNVYKLNFY